MKCLISICLVIVVLVPTPAALRADDVDDYVLGQLNNMPIPGLSLAVVWGDRRADPPGHDTYWGLIVPGSGLLRLQWFDDAIKKKSREHAVSPTAVNAPGFTAQFSSLTNRCAASAA